MALKKSSGQMRNGLCSTLLRISKISGFGHLKTRELQGTGRKEDRVLSYRNRWARFCLLALPWLNSERVESPQANQEGL